MSTSFSQHHAIYSSLTVFLSKLNNNQLGEWIVDQENDGSPDHPIHFPFVAYSEEVSEFVEAVYGFIHEHPEMELNHYGNILEKVGLRWEMDSMCKADVERLDGVTVMALIVGAIRADRFNEGILLKFFEKGYIQKWLARLQEIDLGHV